MNLYAECTCVTHILCKIFYRASSEEAYKEKKNTNACQMGTARLRWAGGMPVPTVGGRDV